MQSQSIFCAPFPCERSIWNCGNLFCPKHAMSRCAWSAKRKGVFSERPRAKAMAEGATSTPACHPDQIGFSRRRPYLPRVQKTNLVRDGDGWKTLGSEIHFATPHLTVA